MSTELHEETPEHRALREANTKRMEAQLAAKLSELTGPPAPDLCTCGHGRAMHFDEDGDHNGPCLFQIGNLPFCKCDMFRQERKGPIIGGGVSAEIMAERDKKYGPCCMGAVPSCAAGCAVEEAARRDARKDRETPTAPDNSERGWLIERRDMVQPVWWCGHSSRGMEWTPNSLEAIRFARKVDADMVNVTLLGSCGETTEHYWVSPWSEGRKVTHETAIVRSVPSVEDDAPPPVEAGGTTPPQDESAGREENIRKLISAAYRSREIPQPPDDETEKWRGAARQFCGAHVGVKQARCPACERDELRASRQPSVDRDAVLKAEVIADYFDGRDEVDKALFEHGYDSMAFANVRHGWLFSTQRIRERLKRDEDFQAADKAYHERSHARLVEAEQKSVAPSAEAETTNGDANAP